MCPPRLFTGYVIRASLVAIKEKARVTTADAEQSTVAAFRPWRGFQVRIPWALAKFAVGIKPNRKEASNTIHSGQIFAEGLGQISLTPTPFGR